MPRGRPSLPATATPASTRNASLAGSATRSGRQTRSNSAKGAHDLPLDIKSDRSSSPDPLVKPPRSRPSRVSMLASEESASASSSAPNGQTPAIKRGRGRPSYTAVVDSASASSVHTLRGSSSEGDYSTPGTSKVPTPAATDPPAPMNSGKARNSIQVQLPSRLQQNNNRERALRTSKYSLNSTSNRRTMGIDDTDDEDDGLFSHSADAEVARRLQAEEYADQSTPAIPQLASLRRSGRQSASTSMDSSPVSFAQQPVKRGRASTITSEKRQPTAKKAKFSSDVDMDAEIAAGNAWDSDGQLFYSHGESPDASSSDPGSVLSSDSDSDSDLHPSIQDSALAKAKRAGLKHPIKRKGSARVQPSSKANPRASKKAAPRRSTRPSASLVVMDSEDEQIDTFSNLPSNESELSSMASGLSSGATSDSDTSAAAPAPGRIAEQRRGYRNSGNSKRLKKERDRLEFHHPEVTTMWDILEKTPVLKAGQAAQPSTISRQLKPFQLEGLAWMMEMEKREWKGGLLGDEMGLGKTIQAVSLIMSDYPAKQPSLVLVPPVALMQWQSEIKSYTDGTLNTFVFHGTNQKTKAMTIKDLKKYDVIMMSYNSLESMYRKQEKGFKRKDGLYKEKSLIHSINFHRVILDEAHCIKTRTTMTAKACFALKTDYRWCLTGTPLQNRIGEFFSLLRFLNIRPFASYLCKQCPCSTLEWTINADNRCTECHHVGMQHVSLFNQELLNPIQKFGNLGPGRQAFQKLRLLTDRIMLRRLKKDHTNSMELPVKEIYVDRQFFGEEENDFANSIMTSGQRKFDTYVAQGVLLNNYANIFGLIMQMRQVADHPDLLLKKNAEGGQNVLVCCICDEPAEDTVRSRCKHDFCRTCVASYVRSTDEPDCPRCHIPLSVDLEQPEIEQDETLMKKTSIINRIKMENWTSSSKIELLVHELHKLRSDNSSHKSIIFSQFTTMLQLIEWRLRRAGITTVMLDGSMTPAQRQASIEHFMGNVDVECFLVSLKAGGVALNLTEASRVFIVDPWWNPAAEWQSADRCHRIGQTRPCTITRLCIEDSVESRMVLIQEKKTSMINSTVNADDKAMDSLTPEDMQFLFRGS